MTEDEAKKKWCPKVRYSVDGIDQNSCNRYVGWIGSNGIYKDVTCIGSDCMMWLLLPVDKWRDPSVREGYCGLAGKP